VAPNLPGTFQKLAENEKMNRIHVHHKTIPWLDLLQLGLRNRSSSLWPPHPVDLHIGIERNLFGLKKHVRA
jgi:hypothetical protein